MKTLKSFLEVYRPKSPDEQKFVDKHVTIKHKDRNEVKGKANEDDVFNASNIKPVDRKANRQGYDVGEDEKVYEEVEELDELSKKTLGSYGSKALRAGLAGDEKRFKGANLASAKMYPKQYEKSPLKAKVPANEEVENVDEARNTNYKATSEKSRFDSGYRAKLVSPLGHLSYISQKSYKTKAHARDAAKYYHSVSHLPVENISSKMRQYEKDYDAKHKVTEELDLESMNESELLDFALDLLEKTLTPAEMKKREEIAKAMERENPGMPMAKKMAIATAQAKKVAEEVEDLEESVAKVAAHLIKRYGDNVRKSHVRSAADDFGVGYVALAHHVRKKLGKTTLAEEDEGWYTHHEMHGKISKENWKKGWRYNNLKDKPFYHQPTKTWHASIKEEVEELDELSKKTLASYAHKATTQAVTKGITGGMQQTTGIRNRDDKETDAGTKKIDKSIKRMVGVQRAVSKLAREDVINRAIEKYLPEDKKFLPLDRLLNRLDGLSEAYVETLISLFESLDEDNQLKMIETAETEEGISGLLDFAIRHRGE